MSTDLENVASLNAPSAAPETAAPETALETVDTETGAFVSRRSDARGDIFVREHMAKDEEIRLARAYTQSAASCGVQVAAAGLPVGMLVMAASGSVVGGLAVAGSVVVGFGLLLLLETSNRIVITGRALVLQTSVLLRRYELTGIEDPRVETLGPLQWWKLDVRIFDPRYFFKKTSGIRFRYRGSRGKPAEVFVAVADADEHLRVLQAAIQAAAAQAGRVEPPTP